MSRHFAVPRPGKAFGRNDATPETDAYAYALSRLYDQMRAAGDDWRAVWDAQLDGVKFDFNHANWRYVAR